MSERTARQIVDWHLAESNRHEELQRTHFNAASAVATAAGIELEPMKEPFTISVLDRYVEENGTIRIGAAVQKFGVEDAVLRNMVLGSRRLEVGNKGWIRIKEVNETPSPSGTLIGIKQGPTVDGASA